MPLPDHEKSQSLRELLLGPLELLTSKEKGISLVILASIFVNSLVDLLGLALVIPVIGIVITPETVEDNQWVAIAYQILSNQWDRGRQSIRHSALLLISGYVHRKGHPEHPY